MSRTDPARFAAAYAALWAAHDVADHIVQTDPQAEGKAADWRMMAGHVGTYHLVQGVAVAWLRRTGARPSWRRTLAAVALSVSTHALLDRRWPVVALLRATGSPGFAAPVVRVDVRGAAVPSALRGRELLVEGTGAGPLPLHGPYLADQALHHAVLAVCAAILAGRPR